MLIVIGVMSFFGGRDSASVFARMRRVPVDGVNQGLVERLRLVVAVAGVVFVEFVLLGFLTLNHQKKCTSSCSLRKVPSE